MSQAGSEFERSACQKPHRIWSKREASRWAADGYLLGKYWVCSRRQENPDKLGVVELLHKWEPEMILLSTVLLVLPLVDPFI